MNELAGMFQEAPGFDVIVEAVKSLGFPVVSVILVFLFVVSPLFLLARTLVGTISTKADSLGGQISGAVTLFSGTLSNMSSRQEASFDLLAGAMNRQSDTMDKQNVLLAQIAEGQRSTMVFMAQNMAQIVQHREAVEPTSPNTTGVIVPVDPDRRTDEPGC